MPIIDTHQRSSGRTLAMARVDAQALQQLGELWPHVIIGSGADYAAILFVENANRHRDELPECILPEVERARKCGYDYLLLLPDLY